MKFLTLNEQTIIAGGVLVPAIEAVAVGVGIFETPVLINSAIMQYEKWGVQIGEAAFNATHPDVLGQMVFSAEEFQH